MADGYLASRRDGSRTAHYLKWTFYQQVKFMNVKTHLFKNGFLEFVRSNNLASLTWKKISFYIKLISKQLASHGPHTPKH